MTIEQEIFAALIAHDAFHDEDQMVQGIAQRAVDHGFETLSARQQAVVSPFLERACEGVKNPGGHHNECRNVIEGKDLVNATENSGYFGGWLCENCRNESDGYENERARFMAE